MGGENPGEGEIDGGGHGVYIRPGTGGPPLGVLFQRRKAALGYLHGGCTGIDVQILGGTQVQNLHAAVGQKHNIVRTQVPVDKARLMDLLHGPDGGEENGFGILPGQCAIFCQMGFQSLAFHKVHDDVSGIIFQK